MPRSKANQTPETSGPIYRAFPDGPTLSDIDSIESPWFVDPRVRSDYLLIAEDPYLAKMSTQQDHPSNIEGSLIKLATMWRDNLGQLPARPDYEIRILTTSSPPKGTQDWVKELKATTRASDGALFTHWCVLFDAWQAYHRREEMKRSKERDRIQNTCNFCQEYAPGQGMKCETCTEALEFYRLSEAASSARGKKAIAKVREARAS